MTSLIRAIQEHCTHFVPAFTFIHAESERTIFRSSALDMQLLGGSPLSFTGKGASPRATPPDERELGRWVLGGNCLIVVSDDGTPIPRVGDDRSGTMTQLYGGYAEIVLTNRRILGAVLDAETVFGRLTRDGSNGVILLALDLDDIDNVTADLGRGLFGGVKEEKISIANIMPASAFLITFDDFVAGGRVLDKLVDAIARRRLEGPIGQRLGATSSGDVILREASGRNTSVTFAR